MQTLTEIHEYECTFAHQTCHLSASEKKSTFQSQNMWPDLTVVVIFCVKQLSIIVFLENETQKGHVSTDTPPSRSWGPFHKKVVPISDIEQTAKV